MDIKIDKFGERLLEVMKNSNPDISESELSESYKFYKYNDLYDENERSLINLVENGGIKESILNKYKSKAIDFNEVEALINSDNMHEKAIGFIWELYTSLPDSISF